MWGAKQRIDKSVARDNSSYYRSSRLEVIVILLGDHHGKGHFESQSSTGNDWITWNQVSVNDGEAIIHTQ